MTKGSYSPVCLANAGMVFLYKELHYPVVASASLVAAGTCLTDGFPNLYGHRALFREHQVATCETP